MDEKLIKLLSDVKYPKLSKSLVEIGAVTAAVFDEDGKPVISLKPIMADEALLDKLREDISEKIKAATGKDPEIVIGTVRNETAAEHTGGSVFKRKKLPGVASVIPVVSGKGGVGKSTVTVNLAESLHALGYSVGILDLDIFGPSIHKMLGVADAKLALEDNKIVPHMTRGLKVVSIGMALNEEDALVIRGPMVMKLLDQLLNEVNWGPLDYLIVDMPPGTGDVPLSLVQQLHVTGALVVTTPQEIALIDVRRAVAMFRQTETKILGIVENMSYFKCSHCGENTEIFGQRKTETEAKKFETELLGTVPINPELRESADAGKVAFESGSEMADTFAGIAKRVVELARKSEKEFLEAEKNLASKPYKKIINT